MDGEAVHAIAWARGQRECTDTFAPVWPKGEHASAVNWDGLGRTCARKLPQVAEESLELALLAAHPGASASGRTPSARMSASALPLHASRFFCSDVKLLSTLHLLHPRACAARPQPAPAPCQWRARMPGAGSAGVRVCQQRLDLVHMFRHDLLARCMHTCACRGPPPCTPCTWAEGWEEEWCGM